MIKDLEEKRCPWMLKCCPEELTQFFSLMMGKTFVEKCMASSGDKLTGSGSTTCKQSIEEFSRQLTTPKYADLSSALDYTPVGFYAIEEWSQRVNDMCTTKERHSVYCESARAETFISCMEKTLEPVAQKDDGKSYSKFVTDLNKELNTVIGIYKESLHKN